MKKSSSPTITAKDVPDFSFSHREEGFDNHIGMSIRGYDLLHDDVVGLSRYFVENDKSVVDIGSSTGKTIRAMISQNNSFAPRAKYIGIEPAKGFAEKMRLTESELRNNGHDVTFIDGDVRDLNGDHIPYQSAFITSLFTLQFISKDDRKMILESVYDKLCDGGAFVFAEKVYATDAQIQDMLTFLYYDHKRKSFTDADILDKERELRNMLKPNTWNDILFQLTLVGFRRVDTFWKSYNFVGAIAIK